MHVIFVNRYFYPDTSATSQILSDLAFSLSGADYDISIVTSRSSYIDKNVAHPRFEKINNVSVHRVWTTRFGKINLIGKAIDYLSFYLLSVIKLLIVVHKGDVVIVKTDPPLISVLVLVICKLKRAKQVNWLQDLFPEVAEESGMAILSGNIGKFIKSIRNISLRNANCNVVIGERMNSLIRLLGVKEKKIKTIQNWSDISKTTANPEILNQYIADWGIKDKFIVGYSGNFGRAHDYETIVNAIDIMRDNDKVVFLFIGGGVYYEKLMDHVKHRKIHNVVFKPYQPRDVLVNSLSVPDVHLISLVPSMEGLIVPSKYYGIAAVGKPVIFIGDVDGEISKIITTEQSGLTVESGNAEQLVDVIEYLRKNEETLTIYGQNAHRLYENAYTMEIAVKKWRNLLKEMF